MKKRMGWGDLPLLVKLGLGYLGFTIATTALVSPFSSAAGKEVVDRGEKDLRELVEKIYEKWESLYEPAEEEAHAALSGLEELADKTGQALDAAWNVWLDEFDPLRYLRDGAVEIPPEDVPEEEEGGNVGHEAAPGQMPLNRRGGR